MMVSHTFLSSCLYRRRTHAHHGRFQQLEDVGWLGWGFCYSSSWVGFWL
jgi:hypothetical protein